MSDIENVDELVKIGVILRWAVLKNGFMINMSVVLKMGGVLNVGSILIMSGVNLLEMDDILV